MGRELILKNNNSFLVRLLRWSHLSGEVFGHHDPQSLSHMTSFICGDFLKERSAAVNQQVWRSLHITFRRLMPAVSSRFFEKLHTHTKRWMLVIKKVEDVLSTCCNYTLFSTLLVFLNVYK